METFDVSIRRARREDAGMLVELVLGLMERLGDDPAGFDRDTFLADAFGEDPQFSVLVADHVGSLVGYALFFPCYEPAFSARGLYLSDLFVAASARRLRVGRRLMAAVARESKRRGRTFVWWVARSDDARAFYRTFADVEQPASAHAITFDAFERLAAEAEGPA